MLKYLKWFFLGILIICIGITMFLYIDFDKQNNNLNDTDISQKDVSIIYDKYWFITGYKIYVDGELIDEKTSNVGNRYLTFTKEYISYCKVGNNECQQSEYSYNDGKMKIPVTFFASRGTYDIIYDEFNMQLSLKGTNSEFIYYFEAAVG